MNTQHIMKSVVYRFSLCLFLILVTQNAEAQRFGHGGGGGGGNRGASAPRQQINNRSFNGGAHEIRRAETRPAPAVQENRFRGHEVEHIHMQGGGYHHDYGSHPYYYHPYHPYIWGPRWHPYGYYMSMLDANAFMFSIASQQYYYDYGVYYIPSNNGYIAVAPPLGAVVNYLPDGYITIQVGDTYYYYYGGAFYIAFGSSFRVVQAPIGAVVYEIPEGATEQVINGVTYLYYNNTYFLPISQNGQDAYEVAEIN